MYDFSKEISKFHDECITLTRDQQADMRGRRESNCKRIIAGLKELEKPSVVDWINQGGYAMQTMTQSPENDADNRYDIDMGAVFDEADAKTARTTKGWVRDAIAIKGTNLNNEPEAKSKCVRVIYADGYQCDFPVFQRKSEGSGYLYEIAIGDDWVRSDPKAINAWFEDEIADKSPDNEGTYQLRRIVRTLKYFAKVHAHRRKLKFPAGLVATALAVECYVAVEGRDDEAFFQTLKTLSFRSKYVPVFANGIIVSDDKDVDRIGRLVDEAAAAVEVLETLNVDENSLSDTDARRAWKKTFRHSFFEEPSSDEKSTRLERKSSVGAGAALATPALASSVVAALSAEEKAQRAESAVDAIRKTGRDAEPWSI